jgi:serine/threonine-protein kinase
MTERLAASLADRYRIERGPDGSLALLGRGGTATVYLAHDLRHDRRVALKVVHPNLAASVGSERFLREIRFVARLSHPHILPLFDSGDAEGLLYYIMPYLAGETLRQRLDRESRLPVATAVRVAREVALALDYAHRNGVIHRDIKPENILFEDDQAVVTDFGIATAMESADSERLTEIGLAIGTPAYMSPEQAGGAAEIDGRSDIYSLGCVLYEMLGGVPPFTGPTPQSVMAKQVVAPPPSLRSQRPEVPEPVERVLAKALEKEPGDRFATAAEFTAALEGAGTAAPAAQSGGRGRPRAAVLVGLGAIAATALLFAVGLGEREEKPPETPRLAVLPFQNLGSADDDYFSDGITEEITSRLAMIPRLGVISRTSAEQYRETGKSIKEIGQELGVDYILEGSVRWEKSGGSSRVRVTPQLIRVSDDRHMWAGRYDETIAEVFQVQSRIAEQVASALDLALQRPHHEALAAKPTDDLRAYDFYLRGNEFLDRPGDPDGLRGAEEMYSRPPRSTRPSRSPLHGSPGPTSGSSTSLSGRGRGSPRRERPPIPRSGSSRTSRRLTWRRARSTTGASSITSGRSRNSAPRTRATRGTVTSPGLADWSSDGWAGGRRRSPTCGERWTWIPARGSRLSICSRCTSGGGTMTPRNAISDARWSWSPTRRPTSIGRS